MEAWFLFRTRKLAFTKFRYFTPAPTVRQYIANHIGKQKYDQHRQHRHFQYIYTFQRDTQCSCTDCLLILGCQLYMFRTVTVHPQELLLRPLRSETFRADTWVLINNRCKYIVYLVGNVYILQKMIHGPSNVKDISIYFKSDFSADTLDMRVLRKLVNGKKWSMQNLHGIHVLNRRKII